MDLVPPLELQIAVAVAATVALFAIPFLKAWRSRERSSGNGESGRPLPATRTQPPEGRP